MARSGFIAISAIVIAALASEAVAQDYPRRPIRLIVPFAAGGTSDIIGRLVGKEVGETLGQQVVIDNRGGAGATIGTAIAAKAMPDGYTLLLSHVGLALNETMHPHREYRALRDLTGISLIGITPSAFAVNNSFPAKSVADFLSVAKAQSGKVTYGSAGIGSSSHLSVELLTFATGVTFSHVPYKGAAPAMTDVGAGQVQFAIPTLPIAMVHHKAGRVRIIATTGEKRSRALPNVPTVAEAGVPQYSFLTWYSIFAPVGTPKEIVRQIHHAVVKALSSIEMQKMFSAEGLEVESSTPEQMNERLRADIDKWHKVIKAAAIIPK